MRSESCSVVRCFLKGSRPKRGCVCDIKGNYFMSGGRRPGLIHGLSEWLSVLVWVDGSCCYFCSFVDCKYIGRKF